MSIILQMDLLTGNLQDPYAFQLSTIQSDTTTNIHPTTADWPPLSGSFFSPPPYTETWSPSATHALDQTSIVGSVESSLITGEEYFDHIDGSSPQWPTGYMPRSYSDFPIPTEDLPKARGNARRSQTDEHLRKARRRSQNRNAQQAYRLRQQNIIQSLQFQLDQLRQENEKLQQSLIDRNGTKEQQQRDPGTLSVVKREEIDEQHPEDTQRREAA